MNNKNMVTLCIYKQDFCVTLIEKKKPINVRQVFSKLNMNFFPQQKIKYF